MLQKNVTGTVEFHSYGDDGGVAAQINEWLQKYPEVSIVDIKYQSLSYVEGNELYFATFALVLYETQSPPPQEINRSVTQRMELPSELKK